MELKERDRNEDAIRGKRKQGGKASPASSKCQLKTTSRKKSLERRAQNSFREDMVLFYLESGSLEFPGETGISFSRGVQSNSTHSAFSLPASHTNSTQQQLSRTTDNTQSPASLVETRLQQVSTKKRKWSGIFFLNFPFPFFFPSNYLF